MDEQLRLNMLLSDSINIPPVHRPYSYNTYQSYFNTNYPPIQSKWFNRELSGFSYDFPGGIRGGLFPVTVRNTVNSRFPYSENNGAAWYGKGNTTEFTGGFYIASGYFSINVQPHIIYQQNQDFLYPRFILTDSDGNTRYLAEGINIAIDAPFRFGPNPFTTFDWGYSSIRLHYKKLEAGLSTEPLWWGASVRYPLIMSNNAPGIHHAFISLREPIRIPYLGKIQLKWIAGYPDESGYYDGDTAGQVRFTNAVNTSFSPAFLKNFTVGIIRVFHLYETDGFEINNLLRIFDPFSRARLVRSQGDDKVRQERNQTASLYAHLHLAETRAEIYFEFFREDHSYNIRDFINQPHHNSAFTFGFQKISNAPWFDFIKSNLEFTNLTASQLSQVRIQTFYYTHSRIRQGHTNRGQLLGAAIGPGSNSQYFSIDAYKGNYKAGFFAQRLVHNDNFHFIRGSASLNPSSNYGDYFRHRVDLNLGLNFLYGPGPFYLQSRLVWTKAYNYGRFDYGRFRGIDVTNYDRYDRTNVQFQIGITYIL